MTATCTQKSGDPLSLYGDELRFRVLRDGSPVGYHRVRFRSEHDRLVVETDFSVQVKLLFFTAYRFEYRSTDVWRDGCLVALQAETDDNGTKTRVDAELQQDEMRITRPGETQSVEKGLFPTTHWNADVLGAKRVLNTVTGGVASVDIVDLGPDQVSAEGREIAARKYRYTGDLQIDVWYDDEGRWVGLQFAAKDGSTIEYVCESCRSSGQAES